MTDIYWPMSKDTKTRNLATLTMLVVFACLLFGIGFIKVNGRNLPEQKKTVFLGINKLIASKK